MTDHMTTDQLRERIADLEESLTAAVEEAGKFRAEVRRIAPWNADARGLLVRLVTGGTGIGNGALRADAERLLERL